MPYFSALVIYRKSGLMGSPEPQEEEGGEERGDQTEIKQVLLQRACN